MFTLADSHSQMAFTKLPYIYEVSCRGAGVWGWLAFLGIDAGEDTWYLKGERVY